MSVFPSVLQAVSAFVCLLPPSPTVHLLLLPLSVGPPPSKSSIVVLYIYISLSLSLSLYTDTYTDPSTNTIVRCGCHQRVGPRVTCFPYNACLHPIAYCCRILLGSIFLQCCSVLKKHSSKDSPSLRMCKPRAIKLLTRES